MKTLTKDKILEYIEIVVRNLDNGNIEYATKCALAFFPHGCLTEYSILKKLESHNKYDEFIVMYKNGRESIS